MLCKKLLKSNEKLIKVWEKIIENKDRNRDLLKGVIADSWIRS